MRYNRGNPEGIPAPGHPGVDWMMRRGARRLIRWRPLPFTVRWLGLHQGFAAAGLAVSYIWAMMGRVRAGSGPQRAGDGESPAAGPRGMGPGADGAKSLRHTACVVAAADGRCVAVAGACVVSSGGPPISGQAGGACQVKRAMVMPMTRPLRVAGSCAPAAEGTPERLSA